MDVTPVLTSTPQDQWDGAQRKADQLGLDTELEEKVAVVVLEAERWQQEWRARREAPPPVTEETPPPTQEVALDMAKVERVVVPAGEGRAVSSDTPLVVSSTRKVSSQCRCLCLRLTTRLSGGERRRRRRTKKWIPRRRRRRRWPRSHRGSQSAWGLRMPARHARGPEWQMSASTGRGRHARAATD